MFEAHKNAPKRLNSSKIGTPLGAHLAIDLVIPAVHLKHRNGRRHRGANHRLLCRGRRVVDLDA